MNTHPLVVCFRSAYTLLIRVGNSLQSPFLLCVRLYWGWQFAQTGFGKLRNHGDVTDFFASLHIPLPGANAWLVGMTECFGGLFLLLGLAARLTAVPLTISLIVAYLTDGIDVVKNIFNAPDDFTKATPFLFLFASLIVLFFGPGVFSIDYLIGRKFGPQASAPAAPPA